MLTCESPFVETDSAQEFTMRDIYLGISLEPTEEHIEERLRCNIVPSPALPVTRRNSRDLWLWTASWMRVRWSHDFTVLPFPGRKPNCQRGSFLQLRPTLRKRAQRDVCEQWEIRPSVLEGMWVVLHSQCTV